jgi:hypothetical protein
VKRNRVSDASTAFVSQSRTALLQVLLLLATKRTYRRIINCPTYPVAVRTRDALEVARAVTEAAVTNPSKFHELLQRLYAAAQPLASRKKHGQFFTPTAVAHWAWREVAPTPGDNVWDAGAGCGVFGIALLRTGVGVASYTGIENDPILALCSALALDAADAPPSFRIWYENFLGANARSSGRDDVPAPTLIVANPPFVRFHNLKGRGDILTTIKARIGLNLSPLSGSFNYFLARAVEVAARNDGSSVTSRITFLLPKEAGGAAHARQLRNDLKQLGWSAREHVIPRELIDSDTDRSAVLALLFEFERSTVAPSQIAVVQDHQSLLGDIVEIRRGISTGCNNFFVLSAEEARQRRIGDKWLRRILPTRIRLETGIFSDADWQELYRAGQKCLLLTLPNMAMEQFDSDIRAYLREGISRGLHDTPTARKLRRWYSLPLPDHPPDIFVSYLFRGSPKVIVNSAQLFHLTNILGGRFRQVTTGEEAQHHLTMAIESEIRTYIQKHAIGREYRDALRKIEPRELQRMPISQRLVELGGRDVTRQLVLSNLK